MAVHRETRGPYLIEASAYHLPKFGPVAATPALVDASQGGKWQPRLTLTRLACDKNLQRSQSFPGLSPVFETSRGATRYATDLGRSMIDEKSPRLIV
ncbi:MAG: hypothetical protein FJY55_10920 [Betaproteobacteria bacterium]|nr:hypothetical protein [Betaproteobacteria bacterium]